MASKIDEYNKLQAQADIAKEAAKEELASKIVESKRNLHNLETEYEKLYGKSTVKRHRRTKAEVLAEKAKGKVVKAANPKTKKTVVKKATAKNQTAN